MSAVLSTCKRYRYRLDREIGSGPVYAFFGINPSTADGTEDDATVRKWKGFTSRWGASRFIIGNIFAFRATDVRELAFTSDPIGPRNADYLKTIAEEADVLVPCRGNKNKIPPALRFRTDWMIRFLATFDKPIMTFGVSKTGDPMHPLMLPYETKLTAFEVTV